MARLAGGFSGWQPRWEKKGSGSFSVGGRQQEMNLTPFVHAIRLTPSLWLEVHEFVFEGDVAVVDFWRWEAVRF